MLALYVKNGTLEFGEACAIIVLEIEVFMKCRLIVFLGFVTLAGCMNMPTPPAQITGSYVSSIKYGDMNCSWLGNELNSLARRESQLVVAQEQRIKSSQVQAFWWGYGQGDGIEASELANIRGEREAVQTAMERKQCTQDNNSNSTATK